MIYILTFEEQKGCEFKSLIKYELLTKAAYKSISFLAAMQVLKCVVKT